MIQNRIARSQVHKRRLKSANSPPRSGSTYRTMPTPKLPSSKKFSSVVFC